MISCPAMAEHTILTAKRIQGELKEHRLLMKDEPVGYRQVTKADDWSVGKFIFPVTSTQGGSVADIRLQYKAAARTIYVSLYQLVGSDSAYIRDGFVEIQQLNTKEGAE